MLSRVLPTSQGLGDNEDVKRTFRAPKGFCAKMSFCAKINLIFIFLFHSTRVASYCRKLPHKQGKSI